MGLSILKWNQGKTYFEYSRAREVRLLYKDTSFVKEWKHYQKIVIKKALKIPTRFYDMQLITS